MYSLLIGPSKTTEKYVVSLLNIFIGIVDNTILNDEVFFIIIIY